MNHFKNQLLTILLLVCSVFLHAQNREIQFETSNWKTVLEKAKKEKKIIFLDCYTVWCGPCKWMEKNVYVNDTVADFYNSNFICVKMNMEKDEGFDLAKKYAIASYPTMLYLNGSGEVVHRTCGSVPPSFFIDNGKDALNPDKQLTSLAKKYNENSSNSKTAFFYFEQVDKACQTNRKLIEQYFMTQKDTDLIQEFNWKMIYRYATYSSKPFQYFESHKNFYAKIYNIDSIDLKINVTYANELEMAHENKDNKLFTELSASLLKLNTKGGALVVKHADLKLEKAPAADIKNAISINDSIVGPVNVSRGFGLVSDFYVHGEMNYKEENSIWFKLDIEYDTTLTLDIVPIDSLDDYDFTIFKCSNANCIKDIASGKIKPIRICRSYCFSKSGVTGLSPFTQNTAIGAGPGPAYVSSFPVKAGETYYIQVDYGEVYLVQKQFPLGFHMYFYNYWPKKKPIVLNNVFFENNQSVLMKNSFSELDKLAERMKKTQMKIEVRGHTDNVGNDEQNQKLSEDRAKAVVDYLISKNISKDRVFYKGFGSSKPVASNENEEGRKKNRRVEFIIVMY